MGKGANWGKPVKKTRGDWGERSVRPFFPRLFRSLFSAPLPYSSRPSSLSERLEQATDNHNLRSGSIFVSLGKLIPAGDSVRINKSDANMYSTG